MCVVHGGKSFWLEPERLKRDREGLRRAGSGEEGRGEKGGREEAETMTVAELEPAMENEEGFEVPYHVALTTYFSYGILFIIGSLRDFYRNIVKKGQRVRQVCLYCLSCVSFRLFRSTSIFLGASGLVLF